MKEKALLRAEMKARRSRLSPDERAAFSRTACERLLNASGDFGLVAVYLATAEEIDLTGFIRALWARGARLAAPAWNGRDYSLRRLSTLDEAGFREGPFGVREPVGGEAVAPEDVTLWIVPGLAFTREGARLGYGGGWYDRLLAQAHPRARRIACAYPFQVLAALPTEPHDRPLDEIVVV